MEDKDISDILTQKQDTFFIQSSPLSSEAIKQKREEAFSEMIDALDKYIDAKMTYHLASANFSKYYYLVQTLPNGEKIDDTARFQEIMNKWVF